MANREEEKVTVEVGGMKVKVKGTARKRIERPKYYCHECNLPFPSVLDLEAHQKIDHAKNESIA
ncbi:MAG TPA: hypothetical protein VF172_13615 [Nitrososphaera sp.]|jgi:hypothetical protein